MGERWSVLNALMFFKQKTAYEMRISDWSSDVCSSDLQDLVLYLETFAHTVGVMQTKDALIRVAKECAEDLAADGIVYAEERFAPELHLEGGLTPDEVVDAVQEGFRLGCAGTQITMGTLVTAMRPAAHPTEIAALAVRQRTKCALCFHTACREAGNPQTRHPPPYPKP